MKKLFSLFRSYFVAEGRTYYYHGQKLTDELERELNKAYSGTGRRF